MDFREIWEFMNTQAALYVYGILIFLLFFIHNRLKNGKIKHLMADERFKDAKLFRSNLTTPVAISSNGYIGVVPSAFSQAILITIKSVVGYEVFFDGHSILKNEASGKKDLVFKDSASLIESRLQERTKKIVLVFMMKDNYMLNVILFNGSTRLSSVMRDSTKEAIKELFRTLEELEKDVRMI